MSSGSPIVQSEKGAIIMRKFPKEYLLFYIQMTFVGIFLLVLLAYNIDISEKSFFENQIYSPQVSGIQVEDPNVMTEQKGTVHMDSARFPENQSYMLYRYLIEAYGEIVRAAYGTEDVFDLSEYLREGRFFSSEDYAKKRKVAVIGTEVLPETWMENGKRYYGYNQQLYEVIGVFEETESPLDYTTYLNLTSVLEAESNYGIFYVDAENKETVASVLNQLQQTLSGEYKISAVTYDSVIDYGLDTMSNTLFQFAVLAGIFHLLLTSVFFVTRQSYTIAVQKLCGLTRKDLLGKYGIRCFGLFLAAAVSIWAWIWVLRTCLGDFFALEKLAGYHYAVMFAGLFLLLTVITVYIVNLAAKVNISDVLKGR